MATDHWHSAAAARTLSVGSVSVVLSTVVPSCLASAAACEVLMPSRPVTPPDRLAGLQRDVRHISFDIFWTSHPAAGAFAARMASYCVQRPATGAGTVVVVVVAAVGAAPSGGWKRSSFHGK